MMYVSTGTSDSLPEIKVAQAKDEIGEKFELVSFSTALITSAEDSRCKDPTPGDYFSVPASNAFLDLDGDCMPDIFLQKTRRVSDTQFQSYFEVYTQKLYKGKQKWCLIQTNSFLNDQTGEGAHSVPLAEFTDLDRNGMVDIVFFDRGNINVFYNMHQPPEFVNAFETQILCRDWQTTSYTDVFQDYYTYNKKTGSPFVTIQSLQEQFSDKIVGLASPLEKYSLYPFFGRLRASDVNIDGFPDLVLTLTFQGSQGGYRNSFVLYNRPCVVSKQNLCKNDLHQQRRYFNAEQKYDAGQGFSMISKITGSDATMLIPLDIDEDGKMDLLVQTGVNSYGIRFIYNNMNYDSFFIKAQMMSPNSDKDPKFGVIPPGATFRYVMTSLEDDNQYVRVASQIPQESWDSLELPYVYQGVGRSNNYLEQFNAAYSIHNRLDQVKVFTPIIPNSQLRILADAESKQDWEIELFINPA